ncbi:hypothetical protein BH23CHL4_BH23CHL4_30480 [soil metagenome]
MHASGEDLPILFGDRTAGLRGIDWGGQRVAILSLPAGADVAPLFQGLPKDMCPAPHWGYIIKGRVRVTYADSPDETLQAGDVFYLPPGHIPIVEEDLEFFEVSPPAEIDAVIAAFSRNSAAAGA